MDINGNVIMSGDFLLYADNCNFESYGTDCFGFDRQLDILGDVLACNGFLITPLPSDVLAGMWNHQEMHCLSLAGNAGFIAAKLLERFKDIPENEVSGKMLLADIVRPGDIKVMGKMFNEIRSQLPHLDIFTALCQDYDGNDGENWNIMEIHFFFAAVRDTEGR